MKAHHQGSASPFPARRFLGDQFAISVTLKPIAGTAVPRRSATRGSARDGFGHEFLPSVEAVALMP